MPPRPRRLADPGETDSPVFATRQSLDVPRTRRSAVTHAFAAIAFYLRGRVRMEQRGEWTLEAGDVLIVPPGEPHRLIDAQRPEFWGLRFCVPCFAADESGRLLEAFDRVRAGASPVVRIPSERRGFLETLLGELETVADRDGRAAPLAVQRSLLTLVLHEIQEAAQWDSGGPASTGNVVADSLRYIERNCLRPLTLKDVGRAVGRTPAYVTTALTRATGRSAVDWIIAGRMAEARRLLLHSHDPMDAIAARVGYADPTHFIRMFRRTHGITPAAWRTARASSR